MSTIYDIRLYHTILSDAILVSAQSCHVSGKTTYQTTTVHVVL